MLLCAITILALRAAGVRRSALVLLGIGIFMALHIPPIGPVALLFLSSGALLIERHRKSPASACARCLPHEIPSARVHAVA